MGRESKKVRFCRGGGGGRLPPLPALIYNEAEAAAVDEGRGEGRLKVERDDSALALPPSPPTHLTPHEAAAARSLPVKTDSPNIATFLG